MTQTAFDVKLAEWQPARVISFCFTGARFEFLKLPTARRFKIQNLKFQIQNGISGAVA